MSTGAELLRQLRKQPRPQQDRHPHRHGESGGDGAKPPSTEEAAAGRATVATAPPPPAGATTIEVCLGPDCSGSGGGAALLEIEELVSAGAAAHVSVEPGGCRDFCTVGPNVRVRKAAGSDGGGGDVHHSRVDGPEACRDVVASAVGRGATAAQASAAGGASAILRRREDGIRWRSHRERAARERRLRRRERPAQAGADP